MYHIVCNGNKMPSLCVDVHSERVVSHYPLPVFGAVHLSHFYSPAVLPLYRCVPLNRSRGNGLVAFQPQSSNGRHRSNKSSIHRHLNFIVSKGCRSTILSKKFIGNSI